MELLSPCSSYLSTALLFRRLSADLSVIASYVTPLSLHASCMPECVRAITRTHSVCVGWAYVSQNNSYVTSRLVLSGYSPADIFIYVFDTRSWLSLFVLCTLLIYSQSSGSLSVG